MSGLIVDFVGILGFILALALGIYEIFIKGKPKVKLELVYSTNYDVNGTLYVNWYRTDVNFIVYRIINIGSGGINLKSCGFLLKGGGRLVLKNGRFFTNPSQTYFPYLLNERRKYEIFYPCEEYQKIPEIDREKITHIYADDEMGKTWKKRLDSKKLIRN